MENILSQFSADNLEIKLTSEKLFINTPASSEAFALRSVNGIGVVDLIDDYNKALTESKSRKTLKRSLLIIGIFMILACLAGIMESGNLVGLAFALVIGGPFVFFGSLISINEPKLMSAVRVMMSGGNRDFQFDKAGIQSGNIAEFVAKVESTLTAYHKNND